MGCWPKAKTDRCMAHYGPGDLPFQYALADAFTLCDAYHCATQTGTNTNRLFLWTGTNDPQGQAGGPSISPRFAPVTAAGSTTWRRSGRPCATWRPTA